MCFTCGQNHFAYYGSYDVLFRHTIQGCYQDFKFPGKYEYKKQAGNQTAKDFFWFYFSSIFL